MIFKKYQLHRILRSGYGDKKELIREFYDEEIAKSYIDSLAAMYINDGYTKAKEGIVPKDHMLLTKIGDQVEFVLSNSEIDDTSAPWKKENE